LCEEDGRRPQVQIANAGHELVEHIRPIYGDAILWHFAQCYGKTEFEQLATLIPCLPDMAR